MIIHRLGLSLITSYLSLVSAKCPFSDTESNVGIENVPDDASHRSLRQREEVAKLQASIISDAKQRNLQQGECVTRTMYESLMDDVERIGITFSLNDGSRGHFYGGIVRLAAHDFMDFDRDPTNAKGGPDGCLDFSAPANAGLEKVWCDSATTCPLKNLYTTVYSSMSRADFWVAAGNAAIRATSINRFVPPFRWSRIDADTCPESTDRLPLDHDCGEVEAVFLTRMGLSWTDATALLGAHTLGRGTESNSQHDGTWVQSPVESAIFDKGYYDELNRRSWRPLFRNGVQHDWTWGGRNQDVMMLNADICLQFDISNPNCCTNTDGNCRNTFQDVQCPTSMNQETVSAIDRFRRGGNNNFAFYSAFSTAWVKATENGYNALKELDAACSPTVSPAPVASLAPTVSSAPSRRRGGGGKNKGKNKGKNHGGKNRGKKNRGKKNRGKKNRGGKNRGS